MLCLLSTAISYQPANVAHRLGRSRRQVLRMAASGDGLDLSVLQQRIERTREAATPVDTRLFVLDAMVPGQRLSFAAPPEMADALQQHDSIVMFGVNPQRRTLCSHGVTLTVESVAEHEEDEEMRIGSTENWFDVVLAAGRLVELVTFNGVEDGSPRGPAMLGHEAKVRPPPRLLPLRLLSYG